MMILEKYVHLKTPLYVLESLRRAEGKESKNLQDINFEDYHFLTKNQTSLLSDSIKYRNEVGRRSNVIPFNAYSPTFAVLDSYRKDFYFYWREQANKGIFLETEISYIFLYSYELINYSYNPNAAYNVSMLEQLYLHYMYRYPKLEKYLPTWISDFLLELGETELASLWKSTGTRIDEEYLTMKSYEESLESISMSVWWKYISERPRSHFFKENKQKIYKIFKEEIQFLHEQYQRKNSKSGVFENLFPIMDTKFSKQLFESAVVERAVLNQEVLVRQRTVSEDYKKILSQLMRIAENFLRLELNANDFLKIDYSILPMETKEEIHAYLFRNKQRERFTKVHYGNANEKGGAIPSPPVETLSPFKLNLSKINDLTKESEHLQEIFSEKYVDDEDEEVPSSLTPNDNEQTYENNTLERLFSDDESSDSEAIEFLNALSTTEKQFLIYLKKINFSIKEATLYAKTNGIMFGTLLIDINDKSEEKLDDVFIEENEEVLEVNEEFLHIFNRLEEM